MAEELPPKNNYLAKLGSGEDEELLSADDMEALEAFCAAVELEEIDFNSWRQLHRQLDLTIRIKITAQEAQVGGQREIRYVRTLSEQFPAEEPGSRRKEELVRTIKWPGNLQEDYQIILAEEGDRCGDECGDLRVIICLP